MQRSILAKQSRMFEPVNIGSSPCPLGAAFVGDPKKADDADSSEEMIDGRGMR